MANTKLTAKQEAFAQEVARNGGDKVAAYKFAGYSTAGNSNTLSKSSDELFNNPKVSPRITQLLGKANKIAEEKFTISVEWRLQKLKEIADMGMDTYEDAAGNKRRENLAAAKGSIETMNSMLGVAEKGGDTKPVKVMVGVVDAS